MTSWYALRTAPQREFAVEEILKRRGMRAFTPTEVKWKRVGRQRKVPHNYPMLPRYVFASGADPWDVIRAYRERGLVQGVVGFDGRPAMISEDAIQRLARMSGGSVPTRSSRVHKAFVAGDKVEIMRGPLQHWIVPIDSINGCAARIIIPMLGTERPVEIPLEDLEAA